jgi:hypothetical protein
MTATAPRPAPAAEKRPVDAAPRWNHDTRRRRLAELLALTGFAVAQPVFDVTGRSPDFFLFRRPSTTALWLLLLVVALVPPLLLWVSEVLVGLVSKTAERVLHLVYAAGLLTTIAVQVGKHSGHYGRKMAAVALLAGIAFTVLLARSPRVRQAVVYASPAPFVFLLAFAMTAPAGALLRPAKASAAAATGGERPPIVMIAFDEFPVRSLLDEKGAIDKRLFPHFAELAAAANWYPNATGLSGWTPYAIPAMLSGRYPFATVAPSYVEYPDNVFTVAGDGYQINAFESISQLCPPQLCSGVPAGRATGFTPLLKDTVEIAKEIVSPRHPKAREGEDFAEQPADVNPAPTKGELKPGFRLSEGKKNQPDRFTSFLGAVGRQADKPTFDFLHILLPHIPWRYLPDGQTYGEHGPNFPLARAKEGDKFRRNLEPAAMTVTKQRMLVQLTYVDGLVGDLVAKMKKSGIWDDALLIMSADHGEGFTPGQKSRLLDNDNAGDLAYVPMFVKTPHQKAGKVDLRNAMNVDLLPTLADVLGVKLSFKVDGVSLLGPPRTSPDKRWYDVPGKPQPVDQAKWATYVRSGIAADIARPELGPDGLFAVGPLKGLYGTKLASLMVAGRAAPRAKAGVTFDKVSLASGKVPALLWGDLDKGFGQTTWLAVSVNGTIAGSVAAAASRADGSWHFVGLVNDTYFVDGRNDVRLYTVEGQTLHPLDWTG